MAGSKPHIQLKFMSEQQKTSMPQNQKPKYIPHTILTFSEQVSGMLG
jgi:hypothetical protein